MASAGYYPDWHGSVLRDVAAVGPLRIRAQVHARGDAYVVWADGPSSYRLFVEAATWKGSGEDDHIEDAIRGAVERATALIESESQRLRDERRMDAEWAT